MKKMISFLLTFAMLFTMVTPIFANNGVGGLNPVMPNSPELTNIANLVLGIIQWVAYAFALGMLLYIGIKYVMSAANEKADLKKGLINYVIGAGIIFAAGSIVGAIQNLIEGAL